MTTDTMLHYADRILAAYVKSSDDDIADGMSWYPRALALATELDPTNVERAAGIIAALSPMTAWPLNVKRAREMYATGTTVGLSNSVKAATRIYNGEAVLDVLNGPKVRSFYLNIMGDDAGVTVDRHAIDVAVGRVLSDSERAATVKRTKARDGYDILRNAYIHAAAILSEEMGRVVTGAQLQAVVWTYWRRNVAAAFHGDVA
jgi:hypothetical protein